MSIKNENQNSRERAKIYIIRYLMLPHRFLNEAIFK